jgi:splicing factor 3B subunit 3
VTEEGYRPVFFRPRPLANLLLVDEAPSLMPLTDMRVANPVGEEVPQIYCTSGRWVAVGFCGGGVVGRFRSGFRG